MEGAALFRSKEETWNLPRKLKLVSSSSKDLALPYPYSYLSSMHREHILK
jgi:hypothetical protein